MSYIFFTEEEFQPNQCIWDFVFMNGEESEAIFHFVYFFMITLQCYSYFKKPVFPQNFRKSLNCVYSYLIFSIAM